MVLQESLEIFLSIFAEEESVDLRTELLEGKVGRCEDGASLMGCLSDSIEETWKLRVSIALRSHNFETLIDWKLRTSLLKAKCQGAEFTRE